MGYNNWENDGSGFNNRRGPRNGRGAKDTEFREPSYDNTREPMADSNREPRAPLQWQVEKTFQNGRVVLVLQSATLDRGGKRWSFRVGKESSTQPDKPFPFMDPRDLVAVREVLAEMEAHLEVLRLSGLED